jgi:hypothetical protein
VKALLSSTRIQDAIMQAMEKYPTILVKDDRVRFEMAKIFRTADDFRPIFDAVVSLAKSMGER